MKNIFKPLLLIVLLAFSCSSDDENSTNINTSELIGTWNLTEVKLDDKSVLTLTDCKKQETLNFISNSEVEWHTPEEDNMKPPCSFFDYDMTYSINGTKVIATWKDISIEIEANQLDSDILTISSSNWIATFSK